MGASAASPGFGCSLSFDGSTIGEIDNIGGPGYTKQAIEITHINSDDSFDEYMNGVNSGGEISFTVQYVPDDPGHVKLLAEAEVAVGTALKEWIVSLNDSLGANVSNWTCKGVMTGLSFKPGGKDDRVTLDVTVRFSGKPAYTVAA